jgi:long-subunit fatty acid transport protein
MLKRRYLILLFLLVFCVAGKAQAQITQTVEISSSPNPVGSGARALGMGGAFIGVADDATAASWNPAGLIQLETPEVSIVGAYNHRTEDTTYAAFPEASGPQSVSTYDLNYLSAAYPFTAFHKNMIVSLNYQYLYDFNKKVGFSYVFSDTIGPPLSLQNNIQYDQDGAFKALSPAFAVQLTPALSFGFTLNVWENGLYDNYWDSTYRSQGTGNFVGFPFHISTAIDERYEMDGLKMDLLRPSHWQNLNFNVGFMWNINERFTIGGVFKSRFEAQLRHTYHFNSAIQFPTNPAANSSNVIDQTETVILDMPMSYGLGLAVRMSDALTLGLDAYRTEWSDYVLRDGQGNEFNPITGKRASESDISDTLQVRVGAEYLFILEKVVIPLRAGVFYDPEPAEGSADDFWGFSIGSGIAYRKIVFDVAYVYRFGRDVRTVTVGNQDSSQDVDQHMVYMSFIYHF